MSDREQLPPATVAYPAVGAGAAPDPASPSPESSAPAYSATRRAAARQDPVASLVLLVSGIAAGISLLLPWLGERDTTGLTLVRDAVTALGDGVGELIGTGYIQPLTIVLGGGVLFLLGLLLLVPARSHRLVGLLALVVAFLVTVAVLVPLAVAGWDLGAFGIGFWFAVAVAVLGVVGAARAALRRPAKA